MKKSILSILLLGMAAIGLAQQDQVLLTIAGEDVMASEFMYIYEKNNQESHLEKKSMEEYLELFIHFKLKVAEAIAQGIDTTEAFKKELAGYRAQAIPKYMQDNEAVDSLVQMSYERMAKPRRASHIAIMCPMDADSATVAEAMRKIELARERVTTGVEKQVKKDRKTITVREPEAFAAVASEMTDDPAGKQNGGELGWIQVFRFVYPFEDAVYTTPVGEVTEIFRSPYGFHIALVEEEGQFEEVNAAHIMKMMPRGEDQLAIQAKAQIDSLYALVMNGADFAEVATAHSDDKGSARNGGSLGWFTRGVMVQPFENITFAMNPGEISKPFPTRFGWHFVKLNDKRGIQPLDSIRGDVLNQVKRDVRMEEAKKSFVAKNRAYYNLPAEMSDEEVRAYAEAHLEERYEDLRHLINEYHDGILLFDVSLREVWDKANKDTEGLAAYFKANKKKYTWDAPRFKGYIIQAKDMASAKAAKQIVKTAKPDSVMSYLNQHVNVDSVTYVKVQRGLWEEGKTAMVDKVAFKNKEAAFTPSEDFPVVIPVGKIIKAPQEYTDERGQVTTDYQDHLEKQWVATLREKYPVVINYEVLESLKK